MDSSIDYVEALKRPFSDMKNLAIGSLLGIIPIVNFIVIGFTLLSTGLTEEKVGRDTLPEWKDYVNLFMKGLVSILIGIILFAITFLINSLASWLVGGNGGRRRGGQL